MPTYSYFTVDVFTNRRFGGNPLAVFPDAQGLNASSMQALAAEMNYSETTFVLPPDDPSNTARVRIFNRTAEMPFAGHPNVGTAWIMSSLGLASAPRLRFEVPAGIVEVSLCADGKVEIEAPQPLSTGPSLPAALVAPCVSIDPARIVTVRRQHLWPRKGVAVNGGIGSRRSDVRNADETQSLQPKIGCQAHQEARRGGGEGHSPGHAPAFLG